MSAINIFISSSFHDSFTLGFNGERDALKAEFSKDKDLNDISLDYGDPQHRGSIETSLDRVAESDLVILFIGSRYGGIVDGEDVSLTHLEYRKAVELGKSLLVYIFPRDIEYPDYDHVSGFIEEVEKDNKTIYADIERLFPKFIYDVLACKTGAREEDDQLKEKQDLYYDALALKVINDISKIKNNIKSRLPFGVAELSDNQNESSKYKQYLSSNTLPYVSRSQFKNEYNLSDDFQSENDLYEKLFEYDAEYDGILVSGEGGVGKTRLMFELGRKAQKDGWTTYQILTGFKGWDTLKLDKGKKYCFLFDYVEENSYFDTAIFDVIKREYTEIEIKIISNARNTYFINNDVNSSCLYRINLSKNKINEKLYLEYVIKKIFQYKNINLNKFSMNIEEIVNKPSFAVFLLQGIIKNGTLDFQNVKGFDDYIKKRLKLTFDKKSFVEIDNNVFRFLFCLPIKEKYIGKGIDKDIIESLEQDGWIEYDETIDSFNSAYNDTIVDQLLISYLDKQEFLSDRRLKEEINSIMEYAINFSQLNHVFWSIKRIYHKSILKEKVELLKNDIQLKCELNIIENINSSIEIMNLFNLNMISMAQHMINTDTFKINQIWAIDILGRESEEVKVFAKKYLKVNHQKFNYAFLNVCLKIVGRESEEAKEFAKKYLDLELKILDKDMIIKCLDLLGRESEEAKEFAKKYLDLELKILDKDMIIKCLDLLGRESEETKKFAKKYLELEPEKTDLSMIDRCMAIVGRRSKEAKKFVKKYLNSDIKIFDFYYIEKYLDLLDKRSEEEKIFAKKYLGIGLEMLDQDMVTKCLGLLGRESEEAKEFTKMHLNAEPEKTGLSMIDTGIAIVGRRSKEAEEFAKKYLNIELEKADLVMMNMCLNIVGRRSKEVEEFAKKYLNIEPEKADLVMMNRCLNIVGRRSKEAEEFAKKYLNIEPEKINLEMMNRSLSIVGTKSEEVKGFAKEYLNTEPEKINLQMMNRCIDIVGTKSEDAKGFAKRYLNIEPEKINLKLKDRCLSIVGREAKKIIKKYFKLNVEDDDKRKLDNSQISIGPKEKSPRDKNELNIINEKQQKRPPSKNPFRK